MIFYQFHLWSWSQGGNGLLRCQAWQQALLLFLLKDDTVRYFCFTQYMLSPQNSHYAVHPTLPWVNEHWWQRQNASHSCVKLGSCFLGFPMPWQSLTWEEPSLVSGMEATASAWVCGREPCRERNRPVLGSAARRQHMFDTVCDQNNISPWWEGKKSKHFILLIKGGKYYEDNSSENLLGVFWNGN